MSGSGRKEQRRKSRGRRRNAKELFHSAMLTLAGLTIAVGVLVLSWFAIDAGVGLFNKVVPERPAESNR